MSNRKRTLRVLFRGKLVLAKLESTPHRYGIKEKLYVEFLDEQSGAPIQFSNLTRRELAWLCREAAAQVMIE